MFLDITPFIRSLVAVFTFTIVIAIWTFRDKNTDKQQTSSNSKKEDTTSKHKKTSSNNNKNQDYNQQQEPNNEDDLSFFGLNQNYTFEELKTAKIKKLKENHPDFVNQMSEDIQNIAKIQTQKINDTFVKLEKKFKNKSN